MLSTLSTQHRRVLLKHPLSLVTKRFFLSSLLPPAPQLSRHAETKHVTVSPDAIFRVVADVDSYSQFVPHCISSTVFRWSLSSPHQKISGSRISELDFSTLRLGDRVDMEAELEIGFQGLSERYTSTVTAIYPLSATAVDTSIFKLLENDWKFRELPLPKNAKLITSSMITQPMQPGPPFKHDPSACAIDFAITFQFQSILHSQIASLFFNEVSRNMVSAFEARAMYIARKAAREKLR
ncbi:dehydrase and lipid transport-domain-containing protein [Cladochytrium replicatum]|nr:dehydrase and lipid transport-domain-containing protein [Cladochytrium replicatum]